MEQFTDENYEAKIKSGAFLIDFYADWCGPCRMMAPALEEVAVEMKDKVTVGKIDVDAAQKAATKFQVTSIPTLVFVKDGKEVARAVGMRDADALRKLINDHL